jgi:hypothetical protein
MAQQASAPISRQQVFALLNEDLATALGNDVADVTWPEERA